jgi:transcriptional regulator with XRE-family HTH domain
MAGPNSPIGSRRRLGAELRQLRNRTGLTLDDVAAQMTCSTSKISRLETGKGIPKVPDIRELMRIYGVNSDSEQQTLLQLVHDGREHGWWEPLTDGVQSERYVLDSPSRYPALENDATTVRSFNPIMMDGLLQTADYARAVSASFLPHHSEEEIDRLVELRIKRQSALHRVDPPPLTIVALLDEAVLQRQVGGPAVMRAQLQQLDGIAELPNVEIRILPFAAGILRAHAGQFVLLEIPAGLGSNVVYIESHAGESYLESASDVDRYGDVHADALRHALPEGESRTMIVRYLKGP